MKMEMRWQFAVLAAACMMLVVAEAAFSPAGETGYQQRRPIVHRTTTVHRHAGPAPTELKGLSQKVYQFTQKVDHFDPLNGKTYQQKYIVTDDNYVPGGPIFLFLGGEAPVEFFDFQTVLPRSLTKQFGALYIALEHRFYGVSMPAPDYSTASLALLSSRQALADAANFLVSFNKTLTNPGPWVVWGCSYSGALSAWFRAKYPNLVVGSVAPSGPVYASLNFTQYYSVFSTAASPQCVETVKRATAMLMAKLSTADGRKELTKTFDACQEISASPQEHYYFLLTLTEAIGGSDQFQNPPAWPLNTTCNTMMQSGDLLANWAQVVNQANGPKAPNACNDFNEETSYLKPLRQPTSSDRSWLFQQCTEFGFFMPTYPGTSVFPLMDLEHQVKWCQNVFGVSGMTPNTEGTNAYYGGYDLRGSNILFTNGDADPWHTLSITKDLPAPAGVRAVTYAAGHCAPLAQPTSQDPVSLQHARVVVANFIASLVQP